MEESITRVHEITIQNIESTSEQSPELTHVVAQKTDVNEDFYINIQQAVTANLAKLPITKKFKKAKKKAAIVAVKANPQISPIEASISLDSCKSASNENSDTSPDFSLRSKGRAISAKINFDLASVVEEESKMIESDKDHCSKATLMLTDPRPHEPMQTARSSKYLGNSGAKSLGKSSSANSVNDDMSLHLTHFDQQETFTADGI